MCPSAARVPTSEASSARTMGLVGASGASRLMHSRPRHCSLRLTAAITSAAISRGETQASSSARALPRMAGSCASIVGDSVVVVISVSLSPGCGLSELWMSHGVNEPWLQLFDQESGCSSDMLLQHVYGYRAIALLAGVKQRVMLHLRLVLVLHRRQHHAHVAVEAAMLGRNQCEELGTLGRRVQA